MLFRSIGLVTQEVSLFEDLGAQANLELFGALYGLEGAALQKAIAEADKSPLGSEKNPVRVNMPAGERYYLGRLRCADGATPTFNRSGSTGVGPFGYILDLYAVKCPGKPAVQVYMDMYHDQPEVRPVPGFGVIAD